MSRAGNMVGSFVTEDRSGAGMPWTADDAARLAGNFYIDGRATKPHVMTPAGPYHVWRLLMSDKDIATIEDKHGDVVRLVEWGRQSGDVIGCLEFADGAEDDGGPTVHVTAEAALRFGRALVAWAQRHGASDGE